LAVDRCAGAHDQAISIRGRPPPARIGGRSRKMALWPINRRPVLLAAATRPPWFQPSPMAAPDMPSDVRVLAARGPIGENRAAKRNSRRTNLSWSPAGRERSTSNTCMFGTAAMGDAAFDDGSGFFLVGRKGNSFGLVEFIDHDRRPCRVLPSNPIDRGRLAGTCRDGRVIAQNASSRGR